MKTKFLFRTGIPLLVAVVLISTHTLAQSPSIAIHLIHRTDSIRIKLTVTNDNSSWRCKGIQAAVTYNPIMVVPVQPGGGGRLPIHDHYFAQYGWVSYSDAFIESDGVDPDLSFYAEMPKQSNGFYQMLPNKVIDLCKMMFLPRVQNPPGPASFGFYQNTGANGMTGYMKDGNPYLQAFASATGSGQFSWPVELESFTARQDGEAVLLEWSTATETNNAGFTIERKFLSDAEWESRGFVTGRGSTTERTTYLFLDRPVTSPGLYRYRLKQTDFDGTRSFSDVVEVSIRSTAIAYTVGPVYPNPSADYAVIPVQLPRDSRLHVWVSDMYGRTLRSIVTDEMDKGYYEFQWLPRSAPAGLYFVHMDATPLDGGSTVRLRTKVFVVK